MAINSESVDPKCWAKADRRVPFQREEAMNDTKGKSVNIPILCGCCSHREVLRKAALLKGGPEAAKPRRKLKICLTESRRVFFSLYQCLFILS